MVTSRQRSRLSRSIQIELIKYFCGGSTACSSAELTGVNRNTAVLFFHKLREVIFTELEALSPPQMSGEIEVDESYFDGRRKGKRGRGASGKVPGPCHDYPKCFYSNAFSHHSGKGSGPIRLSIRTHSELTMCSMYQSSITCGSTTQSCLQMTKTISMALKIFGASQSGISGATTVFPQSIPPVPERVRMAL